jgi:uncharacterized ion transporter superfamily protein YfcC
MPGEQFAGFLFSQSNLKSERKIAMNIADIFLATGTGILIVVVIAGTLIITWYLCVTTPRRTKH